MRKSVVLLFLGFIVLISCKSKSINESNSSFENKEINYIPYYLAVQKADSLYQIGDFEATFNKLDSLFKIYKPLNTDTYQEYSIYLGSAVMSDHFDKIQSKAKFGILNFGSIVTNHKEWVAIYVGVIKASHLRKNEIEALENEYKKKINIQLRDVILDMCHQDQLVRINNSLKEDVDLVDIKNKKLLEEIFKNYGFPSNDLIGSNNTSNDFIDIKSLLVHQSKDFKKKYLPFIFENVKNGKCDPRIYAAVYDRLIWEEDNKQYYGTYSSKNKEFYPPLFSNSIDSIRKAIGMEHILYNDWKLMMIQNKN